MATHFSSLREKEQKKRRGGGQVDNSARTRLVRPAKHRRPRMQVAHRTLYGGKPAEVSTRVRPREFDPASPPRTPVPGVGTCEFEPVAVGAGPDESRPRSPGLHGLPADDAAETEELAVEFPVECQWCSPAATQESVLPRLEPKGRP